MKRVDLEEVLGQRVGQLEGDLESFVEVGSGECRGRYASGVAEGDLLLSVRLQSATTEEASERRAAIAGEVPGLLPPDEVYEERDGAIWGEGLGAGGSSSSLAVSYVFIDDTMVTLLLMRGADGRDRAADHLALTEQIAEAYGLDGGGRS